MNPQVLPYLLACLVLAVVGVVVVLVQRRPGTRVRVWIGRWLHVDVSSEADD